MAQPIPAFASCFQDPMTRGNPRDVYLWMHEHLDVLTYRPVKHSSIEAALRMEDSSVALAIRRLVELGYIERGAKDGKVWTYRLIYSKPLDAVLPAKLDHKSA